MRNLAITVMSMILTTVVIGNAYYQKKQFYPSVVYITKSNPSMAIIYIQAFIIVIIMGKLMRRIFFGELRAVELEHLMERSWYAITETCLAFTVFRDDFNPKFLALFTLLLFLKAFHWLADERVDYMERSPVISWLFHIRIISLLILLGILDVLFVCHAYQSTLNKGASVQLVFGFEYAILLTIVLNIVIKYAFHVNDFHELPWENKAVFLLYTELIMGFIKVILYFSFVIIMVRIYTLPLFAFRPMYYTVRAFKKAVNDVVMSRRAIRNMNTLYPDATAEELAAMDNVCIICREEMRSAAKKLPCNHIFHTSCLRSWFQRQQTCPTCRLNILRTPASAAATAAAAGAGAAGAPQAAPAAGAAVAPAGGAVGAAAAPAGQPPRFRDRTAQTNGAAASGQTPRLRDRTAQTNGAAATSAQQARLRDRTAQTYGQFPIPGVNGTAHLNHTEGVDSLGASLGYTFAPLPQLDQDNAPLIPPFPFMAFNVPPPMPPPDGLSAEEMRRLEQDTREGMEQRIQYLYSIQAMLDTSIIMMQQYCAAIAAASRASNLISAPNTSGKAQSGASSSEAQSGTSRSEAEDSEEVGLDSDDSATPASLNSILEANVNLEDTSSVSQESADKSATVSDSKSTSEQEILRQRRLEKFSKNN
ncbi:septin interacting protein 3 isoform X2 [Rhodnius prolixus]|uniref:septin interacting protein 3 isoform X2 n=1 Tax=Rhodnius prolixus TaxID=13249 RepID=UPI003D18918C